MGCDYWTFFKKQDVENGKITFKELYSDKLIPIPDDLGTTTVKHFSACAFCYYSHYFVYDFSLYDDTSELKQRIKIAKDKLVANTKFVPDRIYPRAWLKATDKNTVLPESAKCYFDELIRCLDTYISDISRFNNAILVEAIGLRIDAICSNLVINEFQLSDNEIMYVNARSDPYTAIADDDVFNVFAVTC